MDDVENGDSVVLEKIDDAVISKEDFTEVFTAEFRDDSADAWILEKRFCEFDDAIDERAVTHKRGVRKSEHLRVLSDDGYYDETMKSEHVIRRGKKTLEVLIRRR